MAFRGAFHLPVSHRPVMEVPKRGALCITCKAIRVHDDGTYHCASHYFQEYMRTSRLPYPPDQMCSDWYEPRG